MGNDLCACWNGDSATADYEQDAAELLSKFKVRLELVFALLSLTCFTGGC